VGKRISNDLLTNMQSKRRKPDYTHYNWFEAEKYPHEKLKEMGYPSLKMLIKDYIDNIKKRCEIGKEPYEFATVYTNSYPNGDIRVCVLGYQVKQERKII